VIFVKSLNAYIGHWIESKRDEKLVSLLEHDFRGPALILHGLCNIDAWLVRVWPEKGCQVGPRLSPHVAQQVSRDRAHRVNDFITVPVNRIYAIIRKFELQKTKLFPNFQGLGINFTNFLRVAFRRVDPKSAKNTVKPSVFWRFWDHHA